MEKGRGLLREKIAELMSIVQLQILTARKSLMFMNTELAGDVFSLERRIDVYELEIDRECEQMLQLFNPMASDMRFVISMLKINGELERIGDLSNNIAEYVIKLSPESYHETIVALKIPRMFDVVLSMFEDALCSFAQNSSEKAKMLFEKDKELNRLNHEASVKFCEMIKSNSDNCQEKLVIYNAAKRLERMGDHIKNIAENLIFYFDAVVVKHPKAKVRIAS